MEIEILNEVIKRNDKGENCAIVTLTSSSGSVPRGAGTMMGVFEDKVIGTIGGGMVEYRVIEEARECIKNDESKYFDYDLTQDKELGMSCGGNVKGYIKLIAPKQKIVIAGAGHIGRALQNILEGSEFEVTVLDDREECNCNNVIIGSYTENIEKLKTDRNTYFVIVTKGHKTDKESLKAMSKKECKYIGMIGSKKKIIEVTKGLEEEGVEIPKEKFYSPIGLKISDGTPYEIAIEILAEILKVKNTGELVHRRI